MLPGHGTGHGGTRSSGPPLRILPESISCRAGSGEVGSSGVWSSLAPGSSSLSSVLDLVLRAELSAGRCWARSCPAQPQLPGTSAEPVPPLASIIRSVSAPTGTFSCAAHLIESPWRCGRRQGCCHGRGQGGGWEGEGQEGRGSAGRVLHPSSAGHGAVTAVGILVILGERVGQCRRERERAGSPIIFAQKACIS